MTIATVATWFTPDPAGTHTWIGQTGDTLAIIERDGISAIATVFGPKGEDGDLNDFDPGDLALLFEIS